MKFYQSIIQVLFANIIQLVTSVIISFFIPYTVSVEDYAVIKEYSLYTSIIALFSFGYYDGLFVRYAAIDRSDVNRNKFLAEKVAFMLLQSLITLAIVLFGVCVDNLVIIMFALTVLPANVFTMYKRIYVSFADFNIYRNKTILFSALYLILNLILILLKIRTAFPYIISSVLSNILILLVCIKDDICFVSSLKRLNYKHIVATLNEHIRVGWVILAGNLIVSFVYVVDRWVVKIFYSITDFAYYSFAVSLLNIILVLIQSVSVPLYNKISKNISVGELKKIRLLLLILGTFVGLLYFVINVFITKYIPKYINSLPIIAISFSAYPCIIVINSIFVNLYKNKKDYSYLRNTIAITIVSLMLNMLVVSFDLTVAGIAYATVISFMIWYISCDYSFDFKFKTNFDYVYIITMAVSYIYINNMKLDVEFSFLIYFMIWLASSLIYCWCNRVHTEGGKYL